MTTNDIIANKSYDANLLNSLSISTLSVEVLRIMEKFFEKKFTFLNKIIIQPNIYIYKKYILK